MIVVDEASMVSLALMARLVEAVRPDARLVLVGDPQQLVSVEAARRWRMWSARRGRGTRERCGRASLTAGRTVGGQHRRVADQSPLLGALADLASAVEAGDGDRVHTGPARRRPLRGLVGAGAGGGAGQLRSPIVDWTGQLIAAARRGDRASALRELARHRVLCAHRRGGDGVSEWNHLIQLWLHDEWPEVATEGTWYEGPAVW